MDESIINLAEVFCTWTPYADEISSIRNWHLHTRWILADNDHLFYMWLISDLELCEEDRELIKDSIHDYCEHLTKDSSFLVQLLDNDVKWKGYPAEKRYSIYDATQAKLLYGERFKPQKPTPPIQLEYPNEHPETQRPDFSTLIGKLKVIPIAETKPRPPSTLLAIIKKAASESIRKELKKHEAANALTQGQAAKILTVSRAEVNRWEKAEKANHGEPTNAWGYRSEYRLNPKYRDKLYELRAMICSWKHAVALRKKNGIVRVFRRSEFIENYTTPAQNTLSGMDEKDIYASIGQMNFNNWINKGN